MKLSELLRSDFAAHYGATWRPKFIVKTENTSSTFFEMIEPDYQKDPCDSCITDKDSGTLVFNNPNGTNIEIIYYDEFACQFSSKRAGSGKRCDFIMDIISEVTVIFVELSNTEEKFIGPFHNISGDQPGKRAYAFDQLKDSVNKLLSIPSVYSYLEQYSRKSGLFGYKLPVISEDEKDLMQKSFTRFTMPEKIISSIQSVTALLPHGFIFEQRLYPDPFIIDRR
jgi:hypothetical protein